MRRIILFFLTLIRKNKNNWGVVKNSSTDEPVIGVLIKLVEPHGYRLISTAMSDFRGRFEFHAKPGSYMMMVDHPKYDAQRISVTVESEDKAPKFDIILKPRESRISEKSHNTSRLFVVVSLVFLAISMLMAGFVALDYTPWFGVSIIIANFMVAFLVARIYQP